MLNAATRHRAPVLWLLLPIICGLTIGNILEQPLSIPALLVASTFALAAAWRRRDSSVALISLVYGLILISLVYFELRKSAADDWLDRPAREMRLTLRIDRLLTASESKPTISGLARVVAVDGSPELVGQQTYFSLRRRGGSGRLKSPTKARLPTQEKPEARPADNEIIPSAEFMASGVLQPIPRSAQVNTFDGFLINSGIYFRFGPGRLIEQTKPATPYRMFCAKTQKKFGAILTQGLEAHPDLSAIIRGMLLGEVVDLSPVQKQLFIESGTLHLFSISGLHIAAIAIALHVLLGVFRLHRSMIFAVSAITLWLYVDITGSSPSAVRAVLMVILLEFAFLIRRAVNPLATLGFAALLAVLANPRELFNASFQMSYGIVAALLLLGLPLGEWLQMKTTLFAELPKVTWRWWHHLLSGAQRWGSTSLGIGAATSLTSAICGIIYFGMFTPGALLVNLLLIPISSLTLWAGFLSLLFGLIGVRPVSILFNNSAALTLLVMEKGIELLMRLPGMFWKGTFANTSVGFISLAAVIAVMLYGYATHWQWRFGGWIPPFALTALALVCAVKFA